MYCVAAAWKAKAAGFCGGSRVFGFLQRESIESEEVERPRLSEMARRAPKLRGGSCVIELGCPPAPDFTGHPLPLLSLQKPPNFKGDLSEGAGICLLLFAIVLSQTLHVCHICLH